MWIADSAAGRSSVHLHTWQGQDTGGAVDWPDLAIAAEIRMTWQFQDQDGDAFWIVRLNPGAEQTAVHTKNYRDHTRHVLYAPGARRLGGVKCHGACAHEDWHLRHLAADLADLDGATPADGPAAAPEPSKGRRRRRAGRYSGRGASQGTRFTDQELHDQSITLLLGGAETTAVLMSWIFHLLHEYPQVAAKLHAELDEMLAGRPVTAADLRKLPYTRNVVAEGLRLYPPAWLLSRRAAVDTTLGGLPVPAGTELSYSPFLLNRDARYFDAPDSFEPDRWLTMSTTPRKGAYLPFGAGNRKCIGDVFALTEAQVIVARYWTRVGRVPGAR
ncbi:cytochrome P450 [Streptomyces sp. NBC_01618]|uniref:cytochrome P450 n=1 Tax=Streptomyces sp. NBC_01618 TaxID=2975900 RepID=UPI003866E7C9|nr:cytochrome P450 [Streptomyces sp. NBC_01618]WTE38305.1 cytochrome P450 [Streptomyces sp. NBC_01618]